MGLFKILLSVSYLASYNDSLVMTMKVMVEWNPLKSDARELSAEVLEFLDSKGVTVLPSSKAKNAEFLITIGGDGTLIYHRKKHHEQNIPIFGIGSASSFICQASKMDWHERLGSIVEHGYRIQKTSMLEIEYQGQKVATCLNEFLVRIIEPRLIYFDVGLYDNEQVAQYKFRADGFMVSTPTGSSGHSYSCFANEIGHDSHKLVLAAICPYRRAFVPVYIPDSYTVEICMDNRYTRTQAICDGLSVFEVDRQDKVLVRKSHQQQGFVYPVVE